MILGFGEDEAVEDGSTRLGSVQIMWARAD